MLRLMHSENSGNEFDYSKGMNTVTKKRNADRVKTIKSIAGIAGLFLMPVISYVLFEYVTGNLGGIAWYMAALNIGWNLVFYLLVFAIFGSTRITVPVVSLSLWVLSLAETFVVAFRDRPIMLWDVMAVRTAMTVTENYVFFVSKEMIAAAVVLLVLNILLWFVPFRAKGIRQRLTFTGGSVGLAAGFLLFFFAYILPQWKLGINVWAVNETYKEYGYMLSTAVSLKYVVKKPPQGYSQAKIKEICRQIEEERPAEEQTALQEEESVQPVNIICIMNESLSELKVAGDFTTNIEYFPFLNSLEENTIKGSLCMPVFGSMTSNSEFEFLTGDSMAILPTNSIAYQFNVKPNTYSLVSTLKDQGYYSVAMHPYPGENWNRKQCYQNMGFDEFLDEEFYEGCQELRNYVSDQADFEKLIEVVEAKENPSDKLFIFNVTMQNHGGYEGIYDNFPQEVYLTGDCQDKYPKADQYLSLMKRSDEAFQYLLDYFEDREEPTMIVMFGDHQPSVEDEFFDQIAGVPSSQVPAPERLMWYETPFVIWTNYEQPSQNMGKLGAVFLSSQVLSAAHLEMTPYNHFLLALSQSVPVVHPIGCFDAEGEYYSWDAAITDQCPYSQMILDYECLVYNHSLDQKKVKEAFVLEGQ